MDTDTVLSRREATLRSATTAGLAGIALVQALQLPSLFQQRGQLGILSLATVALCIGAGLALAAGAGAARMAWRLVAATAVLVIGGWAAPRSFPVPHLTNLTTDHWVALPAAALAAGCLAIAVVGAGSPKVLTGDLFKGGALLFAVVLALLIALSPAPPKADPAEFAHTGHTTGLAAGSSAKTQPIYENTIKFRPGRQGGHFLVPVPAPRHPTPFGIALALAATAMFPYGAVGYLRRRTAPIPPTPAVLPVVEGGLA